MDARNNGGLTITLPSDREIAMTRTFDAPRELVWKAWTEPQHVARWYGCKALTLAVCEIDLRVGGAYRFVMRAADGTDYPKSGVYREIVPPTKLVYTERFNDDPNKEALITFWLDEDGGVTTLWSMARYKSAEDRDTVIRMGVEAGTRESLDRLADVLRTMTVSAAGPTKHFVC